MIVKLPLIFIAACLVSSCTPSKKETNTNFAPGEIPPGMVWIPGGEFTMGGTEAEPPTSALPVHSVKVDGFWMDETEVTNAQFKTFVEATGYNTVAERPLDWEELKKQVGHFISQFVEVSKVFLLRVFQYLFSDPNTYPAGNLFSAHSRQPAPSQGNFGVYFNHDPFHSISFNSQPAVAGSAQQR